jgi:hypothetical protein
MSMGKGLDAILKAPNKLKSMGDKEAITEVVTTTEVHTGGVNTNERSTVEVPTNEVATAKVSVEEVVTEEVPTNQVTVKKEASEEIIGGPVTTNAVTTNAVTTEEVSTTQVTTGGVTISQDVIAKAISDAKRSPRISTWSPVAVGTLKSLWMTQPQFSMSDEIRTLVEEGLTRKYPQLVNMVKKELEKK